MPEPGYSCVEPARGPLVARADPEPPERGVSREEEIIMTARVGKTAPDFEAIAFHNGGFIKLKLSDHFGHWTLLCFYPGDFTFV